MREDHADELTKADDTAIFCNQHNVDYLISSVGTRCIPVRYRPGEAS